MDITEAIISNICTGLTSDILSGRKELIVTLANVQKD